MSGPGIKANWKWSNKKWQELNSPIPVHFSLLIPRMSTFTLAISCLTTSNLPWFLDLTFQVPMKYCSLQHQTLLLSPVTSTAGYSFCFGSIPPFFLELFLHWSPVAYWAPTDLGRNNSRKNGGMEPKQKQHPVWMSLVMEESLMLQRARLHRDLEC